MYCKQEVTAVSTRSTCGTMAIALTVVCDIKVVGPRNLVKVALVVVRTWTRRMQNSYIAGSTSLVSFEVRTSENGEGFSHKQTKTGKEQLIV
jgi:hypothetical protein